MKTKTGTKPTNSRRKKTEIPSINIEREVKHSLPTPDDVKRRAYEIYLHRMRAGQPGSPESDWSRAEHELGRSR